MKSKIPTILAVDFDDTIAHVKFPTIIGPRFGAKKYLQKLKDEGFYIIVWTCRCDEPVEEAYVWLMENNIPFERINKHHPALIEFYQNDTRKIAADIYIDDKNLSLFPIMPWPILYWMIKIKAYFLRNKKALKYCY